MKERKAAYDWLDRQYGEHQWEFSRAQMVEAFTTGYQRRKDERPSHRSGSVDSDRNLSPARNKKAPESGNSARA